MSETTVELLVKQIESMGYEVELAAGRVVVRQLSPPKQGGRTDGEGGGDGEAEPTRTA